MELDKNYNLTQSYGINTEDEAPKWMDDFFNHKAEKKENPFKGVDNFLNIGLDKKGEK